MESLETVTKDWTELYAAQKKELEAPVLLIGEVVHGFKRGSKELGIPTANLSMVDLGQTGKNLATGVYYGWCRLRGDCFKAVASVGWNPHFQNTEKTVEAHLLAKLEDFYGERIELLLLGYLRDEQKFDSLDELISCIHSDIDMSTRALETDRLASYSQRSWNIS